MVSQKKPKQKNALRQRLRMFLTQIQGFLFEISIFVDKFTFNSSQQKG